MRIEINPTIAATGGLRTACPRSFASTGPLAVRSAYLLPLTSLLEEYAAHMVSIEPIRPLPAVPYLKIPEDGAPYLTGSRCGACGQIFLGERQVCGRCCARDKM